MGLSLDFEDYARLVLADVPDTSRIFLIIIFSY